MTFASREDAGRRLGYYLLERATTVDVVVGLPRGGVVVAAETAGVLQRPLDVLVVRKIGHPLHREFAIGSLAEEGVVVLDEIARRADPFLRTRLEAVIREEEERLRQYESRFHREGKTGFSGRSVLLVDDGLATGATMEAAALSARKQGAREVVVSAPVASAAAVERLRHVGEVVVPLVDPDFDAVGRYYEFFTQTSDEEVIDLLRRRHSSW